MCAGSGSLNIPGFLVHKDSTRCQNQASNRLHKNKLEFSTFRSWLIPRWVEKVKKYKYGCRILTNGNSALGARVAADQKPNNPQQANAVRLYQARNQDMVSHETPPCGFCSWWLLTSLAIRLSSVTLSKGWYGQA